MRLIKFRILEVKETEQGFDTKVEFRFEADSNAILGKNWIERFVNWLKVGKIEPWQGE